MGRGLADQIAAMVESSPTAETGGILIGHVENRWAIVLRATGPGPKAERSADIFRREVAHVQAERDLAADELGARGQPAARSLLTERDLQREAIRCAFVSPHLLIRGRANAISACIERDWGITGLLKDLPRDPRWIINATTYESGKNWQFMPQRMGDHVLNYVRDPAFPVADAVVASTGFPVLIGPLLLDARAYEWWRYIPGSTREMERTERKVDRIRLWDGGVYDNIGVEPLFKPNGRGLRDDFTFLIVSDASGDLEFKPPKWGVPRILRPTNIAMDQVRSLRARTLVDHFSRHPGSGVYLRIGRSTRYLLEQAGVPSERVAATVPRCLDDEEVHLAASFRTPWYGSSGSWVPLLRHAS